jgi:predicted TIM-barrel fold metal-dependent hydrolase
MIRSSISMALASPRDVGVRLAGTTTLYLGAELMTTRTVDFPVVDADNHLYETEDAFTRYLPSEYESAVRYVQVKGRTKIAIRNTISEYIPNPTLEVVAAPGAHEELYRHGNPDGKTLRELTGKPIACPDWAREPTSRVAKFDELGLDAALMFPTLASLLEERMRDDPDLTHAAVHAFNRWLHDEWTFNYRDRVFPTPVITLPIVEKAVAELEWCLERGARAVLIRPAPAWGLRGPRSPAMAEFDPLWARIQEAGVLVAMHASDSGYADIAGMWEGRGEFLPFKPNPMRAMVMGSRPIMDTMAAMVCHGALSRFPDLRIATVENGGTWVRPLLDNFRGVYKKMPHEFAEHPIEAFTRNVYVNPFWEDGLGGLIEAIGSERVLFGSDFPHPEGMAEPLAFVDELPDDLGRDDVARIMGGNLASLLKIAG